LPVRPRIPHRPARLPGGLAGGNIVAAGIALRVIDSLTSTGRCEPGWSSSVLPSRASRKDFSGANTSRHQAKLRTQRSAEPASVVHGRSGHAFSYSISGLTHALHCSGLMLLANLLQRTLAKSVGGGHKRRFPSKL